MELGRRNFIMGYDPLGWGGDTHGIRKKKISWDTTLYGGGGIPGIRKKKFYHGHERGWLWGSPQYREARVGERGVTRGERGARGDGDGRQGERGPEGQRKF